MPSLLVLSPMRPPTSLAWARSPTTPPPASAATASLGTATARTTAASCCERLGKAIDGTVGNVLQIADQSHIDLTDLTLHTNTRIGLTSGASNKLFTRDSTDHAIGRFGQCRMSRSKARTLTGARNGTPPATTRTIANRAWVSPSSLARLTLVDSIRARAFFIVEK